MSTNIERIANLLHVPFPEAIVFTNTAKHLASLPHLSLYNVSTCLEKYLQQIHRTDVNPKTFADYLRKEFAPAPVAVPRSPLVIPPAQRAVPTPAQHAPSPGPPPVVSIPALRTSPPPGPRAVPPQPTAVRPVIPLVPTVVQPLQIVAMPPVQSESTRTRQLPEYLHKYRIEYLYHITSIRNLKSIFQHGILSHNEAYQQKLIQEDISMDEVQRRRRCAVDSIFSCPIHDYASLYFNARNPMLSKKRELRQTLVVLGVDPAVLAADRTVFTDGNAGSDSTLFYHDLLDLDKVPWAVLNAQYWTDYEDGKRQRCAEALIYPRVEATQIRSMFVLSDEAAMAAKRETPHGVNLDVHVKPGMFF